MSTTTPPTGTSRRSLLLPAVLIGLTLAFLTWHSWPDGRLRVIFLETNGDAVLIETASGGYVLIDGGGDPAALAAALGRRLPFWRRTLDAVVLTSWDGAHVPGQVAALARYRAALAIAPPAPKRGAYVAEWRHLLADQGTPIHFARTNQRLRLGGATLRVLSAGDGGAAGMVLRLDYGTTSVVFDHGGDEAGEAALAVRARRGVNLLAFPWQRDPQAAVVAALAPRAIVFTDGWQADKPPEQTFVERAIGGAALYHERIDGAITWISDGARAWIETER
jgi:hypothetical protein